MGNSSQTTSNTSDAFRECVAQVLIGFGHTISRGKINGFEYLELRDIGGNESAIPDRLLCFNQELAVDQKFIDGVGVVPTLVVDDSRADWDKYTLQGTTHGYEVAPFFRSFLSLDRRVLAREISIHGAEGEDKLIWIRPGGDTGEVIEQEILTKTFVDSYSKAFARSADAKEYGDYVSGYEASERDYLLEPCNRGLLVGLPGTGKSNVLGEVYNALLRSYENAKNSGDPICIPIWIPVDRSRGGNFLSEAIKQLREGWGLSLTEEVVTALIRAGFIVVMLDDLDLWAVLGDLDPGSSDMSHLFSILSQTGRFLISCGSQNAFLEMLSRPRADRQTYLKNLGRYFFDSPDLRLLEIEVAPLGESFTNRSATRTEGAKTGTYPQYLRAMTDRYVHGMQSQPLGEWADTDLLKEAIECWCRGGKDWFAKPKEDLSFEKIDDKQSCDMETNAGNSNFADSFDAFSLFGEWERREFIGLMALHNVRSDRTWVPIDDIYEWILNSLNRNNRTAANVDRVLDIIGECYLFEVKKASGVRFVYQTLYERCLSFEIKRYADNARSDVGLSLVDILSDNVIPSYIWDIVLGELDRIQGLKSFFIAYLLEDKSKGLLHHLLRSSGSQQQESLKANTIRLLAALFRNGIRVNIPTDNTNRISLVGARQQLFKEFAFHRLDLQRADFTQSVFINCSFDDCDLSEAILDGTIFRDCSFSQTVTLRNTLLGGAILDKPEGLFNADLDNVVMLGVLEKNMYVSESDFAAIANSCTLDKSIWNVDVPGKEPYHFPGDDFYVQSMSLKLIHGRRGFDALPPGIFQSFNDDLAAFVHPDGKQVIVRSLLRDTSPESLQFGSQKIRRIQFVHPKNLSGCAGTPHLLIMTKHGVDFVSIISTDGNQCRLARPRRLISDTDIGDSTMSFKDISIIAGNNSATVVVAASSNTATILIPVNLDYESNQFAVSNHIPVEIGNVVNCALISKETSMFCALCDEKGYLYLLEASSNGENEAAVIKEYLSVSASIDFIKYEELARLIVVAYGGANILLLDCPQESPRLLESSRINLNYDEIVDASIPSNMKSYLLIAGKNRPRESAVGLLPASTKDLSMSVYSTLTKRIIADWDFENLSDPEQEFWKYLLASANRQVAKLERNDGNLDREELERFLDSLTLVLAPTDTDSALIIEPGELETYHLMVVAGDNEYRQSSIYKRIVREHQLQAYLKLFLHTEDEVEPETFFVPHSEMLIDAVDSTGYKLTFRKKIGTTRGGKVDIKLALSLPGISEPSVIGPVSVPIGSFNPYKDVNRELRGKGELSMFFGRDQELSKARECIRQGAGFKIQGSRKVGKSSFINKLIETYPWFDPGHDRRGNPILPVKISCDEIATSLCEDPVGALITAASNWLEDNYRYLFPGIEELKASAKANHNLVALFSDLSKAATGFPSVSFVIFFDEFGIIKDSLKNKVDLFNNLMSVFHGLLAKDTIQCACVSDPPIRVSDEFLLMGSFYQSHFANHIILGPMSQQQAMDLIEVPLKGVRVVEIDGKAKELCLKLSSLVPRDVQCIMKNAFDQAIKDNKVAGKWRINVEHIWRGFETDLEFWRPFFTSTPGSKGYYGEDGIPPDVQDWLASEFSSDGTVRTIRTRFKAEDLRKKFPDHYLSFFRNWGFSIGERSSEEIWLPAGLLWFLRPLDWGVF